MASHEAGDLARRVEALERRIAALEAERSAPTQTTAAGNAARTDADVARRAPASTPPKGAAEAERPQADQHIAAAVGAKGRGAGGLPDVLPKLSGTLLFALGGGALVVLGAVFLLTLAIRRGWITPSIQVLLAWVGGALLLGGGTLLHRRRAALGAGIAPLSLTLIGVGGGIMILGNVAAARLYDEAVLGVTPLIGMVLTGLVGAAVVGAALRFSSQIVAAFGVGVALLAPALLSLDASWSAMGFVDVALVLVVPVVGLKRWHWLSRVALAVTGPQLAYFVWDGTVDEANGASAITAGVLWWCLVTAGPLVTALLPERGPRRDPQALEQRLPPGSIVPLAATALVTVVTSLFLFDHAPELRTPFYLGFAGANAALAVAFALAAAHRSRLRWLCGWYASGAAGVAAWGAYDILDGPTLVIALFALAAATFEVWARRRDAVAFLAAAGLALFGLIRTLSDDLAPPAALVAGAPRLAHATMALAACGGVLLFAALRTRGLPPFAFGAATTAGAAPAGRSQKPVALTRPLAMAAGLVALWLASIVVVTLLSPHITVSTIRSEGMALPHAQSAQLALSLLWICVAMAALVAGLALRSRNLRLIGIVLSVITSAKVLLVDTAALESGYRVVAFTIVGLLLLAGAYVLHLMDKRVAQREPVPKGS